MRFTVALGALVALLTLASTASASYGPPPKQPVCTDNGTTLYVADVDAFLAEFPDATAGECVVAETPAAAAIAAPGHQFFCEAWQARWFGSLPQVSLLGTVFKPGDFTPHAIPGNPAGGDNLGSYTLVCNSGALKPTGSVVDGSGQVFGLDVLTAFRASWGTDANVYPLFELGG